MTLNDGKKLIELILHREFNGGRLKPADYNVILSEVYIPFTKNILETIITQRLNTDDQSYRSTKSLRELLVVEDISPSLGVFDLTTLNWRYLYWDFLYSNYGGNIREIKLVDGDVFVKRISDILSEDPEQYPFATIRGNELVVRPADLSPATLQYYREPVKPVYDYYIDVNGNIQYLTEDAVHTWVTGEKDSSGTSHTTGQPDYISLTKELEFNKDLHLDFFNEVLQRMGVKVEHELVLNYAKALKQEQEAK